MANALETLLADFRADPKSSQPPLVQKAVYLAARLQRRAAELQTPQEKRQQAELDRMLQNPRDKTTMVEMTDQAFRSHTAKRSVEQFIHILDVQGVPRFFSPLDRALLKGFQSFGGYLPDVAAPLVKERMHKETANVILPAEHDLLAEYLVKRREQGIRMNVNFLGEAILSEPDAARRLDQYLEALQIPETEVFSVKISTLYSQISSLARDHTISVLCDRLERLYRSAARMTFRRADGTTVPKFIYLDMEEYRDLALTCEAFMRTLDRRGLESVRAGIALQAYIPDSARWQRALNDWARRRAAADGAPITIRVVKGANMESERVEASLRGWPQAPFQTKLDTDANYKRMLLEGFRPENLVAVRLGIASHNLFDVSYGLALAADHNALDHVQFEMLEGMANHQRRALFEQVHNLLLYAPVCGREDFLYAIGYLIRRLDENTGPDNFLRHAFRLEVDSDDWRQLERGFVESCERAKNVSDAPRRTQNRNQPLAQRNPVKSSWQQFVNEPDTDFALPQNVEWAEQIIAKWQPLCDARASEIPLVIAGEEIFEKGNVRNCLDPSRPGVVVGRYRVASEEDVARAVACAAADPDGWRVRSQSERGSILRRVAQELRGARGDLMGSALANGGKILTESDPEVSEAVDFVEFYADTARFFNELPTLKSRGVGVVVVVSPWNFPIAIPCGGVAAALAAGNTVILKPASDTVLVAHEFCKCFWRAGVPKSALQFAPCTGNSVASQMIRDPRVNTVILTGGTATALTMLRGKPDLPLCAETGGKNATIVTAMSDRDQAIKHVLHSAFSHSGQKCSATSLLLLEGEVYDDAGFRQTLCEAIESLRIGSAWDLRTRMGPLIRPPSGDLETALQTLEAGESWAVMPRRDDTNPNLWSPGVKWGVQPGGYTHLTEFFGPVLGVMRFEKLHQAIALVNQTGYGLTSGLESLDDREQEEWKAGIRAGNLYINRTTVGAVVLRQPFGGMGKSVFGVGLKAGGPNYVVQLMNFEETGTPSGDEVSDPLLAELCARLREQNEGRLVAAIASYDRNCREEFGVEHDHFRLVGQDNIRRYRPIGSVRVRVHLEDSLFEIIARVCAAKVTRNRVVVSVPPRTESSALSLLHKFTEHWAAAIEFVEESDGELAVAIRGGQTDRVRYAARDRVPKVVWEASAETGIFVATAPVLAEGRVELLWYAREQSISNDYHRYGNLGGRAGEPRSEVL